MQYLASGLATGALYGVVAVGVVLVYRASGVINFAHGEMATLSTFAVYSLWTAGVPVGVAILAGLLLAAVLGPMVERFALRPMRNRSHVNEVIMTVALFLVFNGLTLALFGTSQERFPALITGPPIRVADVVFTRQALLILVFTAILSLGLTIFLRRTGAGIAMRAIAEDPAAARQVGLPVGRIVAVVWAVAAVTGAAAGILVAPIVFLSLNMMLDLLIKAFAGAVLGGLTSIAGALVGGILLGVAENLLSGYVSSQLANPFTFVAIIAVLVIRPQGLLGRAADVKL